MMTVLRGVLSAGNVDLEIAIGAFAVRLVLELAVARR